MSILSSIGSGKLLFIKQFFEENYPKIKTETKTDKNGEYAVVLKPMYKYGYLNIDLSQLPCRIDFENMPSLHIFNANSENIKKLPKDFVKKCNEYKFENTVFKADDIQFVINWHEHIYNSTIYMNDIFSSDDELLLTDLSAEAVLQSNVIMIKYQNSSSYTNFVWDTWKTFHL